mgnify:CR=1 FL=1
MVISMGEGRKNIMAKIEVIKQRDLQDCGACSLLCIIKYYGGYVPIEKIREDTQTSLNGTTAFHLINAAQNYGFEALGIKTQLDSQDIYLPAIVHLKLKNGLEHFAVLYKITSKNIYLMDPARGKVKLSVTEFNELWDNIMLLFTPINRILTMNKDVTFLNLFQKLLIKNKKLFLYIFFVNLLFIILAIIGNFYFQLAISNVNSGTDKKFMILLVSCFFLIIVFKVLLEYIKNYYQNYLNKNLDVEIYSSFLSHIFHLPLGFTENRTTGEIVTRVQELAEAKNLLTEIFCNVLLNVILILGATVVLYFVCDKLFFILCFIIIIYLILTFISSKVIYSKMQETIEASTDFNTILVENIDINSSIKNLNLTNKFLKRLDGGLTNMLYQNFRLTSIVNVLEFLKKSVYEVGLFVITTFGIYLIYQGRLEVLTFVTFNSLVSYIMNPLGEICSLVPKYNYLKASFKKIGELIALEVEEEREGLELEVIPSLQLKNLKYSYNLYSNILDIKDIEIKSGERVMLMGPSGSGKSTLCKIIAANYLSEINGEYCIENIRSYDYSTKTLKNSILYVGQNEKLFSANIRDNIVCFRDIKDDEFKNITRICHIDDIVDKRPNRYNSIINASINNLSGGEVQRIILARALLKRAKVIILDEALSEVNIDMERSILKNIFAYFKDITFIYVSHKDVSDLFLRVIPMENIHE